MITQIISITTQQLYRNLDISLIAFQLGLKTHTVVSLKLKSAALRRRVSRNKEFGILNVERSRPGCSVQCGDETLMPSGSL